MIVLFPGFPHTDRQLFRVIAGLTRTTGIPKTPLPTVEALATKQLLTQT